MSKQCMWSRLPDGTWGVRSDFNDQAGMYVTVFRSDNTQSIVRLGGVEGRYSYIDNNNEQVYYKYYVGGICIAK